MHLGKLKIKRMILNLYLSLIIFGLNMTSKLALIELKVRNEEKFWNLDLKC